MLAPWAMDLAPNPLLFGKILSLHLGQLTLNRGAYFEDTSGKNSFQIWTRRLFFPLLSLPPSLSLSVSAPGVSQAKVSTAFAHSRISAPAAEMGWQSPCPIGEEKYWPRWS